MEDRERLDPVWVKVLWNALDHMDGPERVKASGDWIVYAVQSLLPTLAHYRRQQVAELLDQDDWDAQRLAETIGSRTVAIMRLAKEGRRARGSFDETGGAS